MSYVGNYHHSVFEDWARRLASLSKSKEEKGKIINYIKGQEEHHRRHKSFSKDIKELFGADFFVNAYNRRDWLDEDCE